MIKKAIEMFSWLWKASKEQRLRLAGACTTALLRVGFSLGFVYLSKKVIDLVSSPGPKDGFWGLISLLAICMLCELGLNIVSHWFSAVADASIKNSLRRSLFTRLMDEKLVGREQVHSGQAINRLEEDVRVVSDALCQSLPYCFVNLIHLVGAFVFLASMNIHLAIAVLCILPLFILFSKIFVKRLRKLTSALRATDSKLHSIMQESLQHRILIRSLEHNQNLSEKLLSYQDLFYKQSKDQSSFTLMSRGLVGMGFMAGHLTAFTWGAVQLGRGLIGYGTMAAFLQLVGQIQRPMSELSRLLPSFIHASTSIDRLRELENREIEEKYTENFIEGIAGIEICNLRFKYPDGNDYVLDGLNNKLAPGSRTAIIGPTGVGKTTFAKLLLSLVQATEGEIYLYDKSGSKTEVSPQTRCNIVYVPQGNSLMSGSIRDNLLMAKPSASEEEIAQALHIAVADFAYELPEGLDTYCGEGGYGLSEGQAQRIGIARGLLRPGSIMLFDEFSSSLDNKTEQELMERLIEYNPERTLIFIAHREMVLKYCDKVIDLFSKL